VRNVRVARQAPESRANIGQVLSERITVENTSPIPKPWLEIRDHSDLPNHEASQVIYLPGNETRSWRVQTVASRRGRFMLGPITLASTDPAGLFRQTRDLGGFGSVLVYPRVIDLPDFQIPGGDLNGESRIKTRTHAVTPNAAGIRDYAPGDSLSRIHWLSTARLGRMIVKDFELDPASEVWIALDLDALVHFGEGQESTEEYAVTAAASIARKLLDTNRAVGLLAYGENNEVVHVDRGDRQISKMLETLALVHATGGIQLAEVITAEAVRFGRNTTIICITPSTDLAWVGSLQHQTHRGARAVAVLVEPTGFGGGQDQAAVQSALATADILTYVVRAGTPIDQSLSRRAAAARQPVAA
jgi:uncharacterized protein (DUF58 family)